MIKDECRREKCIAYTDDVEIHQYMEIPYFKHIFKCTAFNIIVKITIEQ